MAFSVSGKRVVVVGGVRSGVAAAELLAARGARVTVADASPSLESADRLARMGVTLDLGPHRADQFVSADLVVLSPGVPPQQAPIQEARRAGVPVIGEVELASRWLSGPHRRDYRDERKVDDDHAGRADAGRRPGWRRRRAAISATR